MAYYLVSDEGSDPVIQSVLGIKRGQLVGVTDPSQVNVARPSRRMARSTWQGLCWQGREGRVCPRGSSCKGNSMPYESRRELADELGV
jgi:hypothetical protein